MMQLTTVPTGRGVSRSDALVATVVEYLLQLPSGLALTVSRRVHGIMLERQQARVCAYEKCRREFPIGEARADKAYCDLVCLCKARHARQAARRRERKAAR